MKKIVWTVVALGLLAALVDGCSSEWTGYAYPNRHNLADARTVGTFGTLEECRAAAINTLRNLQSDTNRGDYECGENCRGSVCKRTER